MAMVLLYNNYYDSLIRIADMHTHDRQASKDVLQEVFADVWQKHKLLGKQRDESIQHYLIKAVQNHSISFHNKKAKKEEHEREYFYSQSNNLTENPAEASIISTETQLFIRVMLGTFPLRERQCLLMQIDHGMRVNEIAQRLGISKKSVERALTCARKRLKKFGGVIS